MMTTDDSILQSAAEWLDDASEWIDRVALPVLGDESDGGNSLVAGLQMKAEELRDRAKAGPDLLEACEELLQLVYDLRGRAFVGDRNRTADPLLLRCIGTGSKAEAAITKARGE